VPIEHQRRLPGRELSKNSTWHSGFEHGRTRARSAEDTRSRASRATSASVASTTEVNVPIVAIGGELSRGDQVREMLESVAEDVTGLVVPGCGHFVPEERPEQVIKQVLRCLER
jgi:pimeloyl-ACP methyl ester carboxylesterase